MTIGNEELKKLVLKSGLVDPTEFEEAARAAADLNKPLTDILVERGVILEKFLGQLLADSMGYKYADLRDRKIETQLLGLLPEEVAREKGAVGGEDLPVVKIFDTILEFAASERASDIHIENVADKIIVRFRVDGRLRDVLELPTTIHSGLISRIKILSNLRTDEHRVPKDGRFRFKHRSDDISVRVSVLPTYQGEDAVLRLLSAAARPKTLEELGVSGKNLEI